MSLMLGQNLGEAPHFVEGIVKWSGRDSDDVWFAEIALHSGGDERVMQLLWMLVRQNG